jgi:hypothetical protein
MSVMGAKNHLLEVSKGNVPGQSVWGGIGERESMGTTAQGEDIWRGNEIAPAPTSDTSIPIPDSAGEQMSVISEHANDTLLGVGVRKVRIHYLDANGDAQTEDVEMNGTTAVDLVAANVRFVNDMYAIEVGSNGVAKGHIKIWKKADHGLVYNMIGLGGNKSLVPNKMVPRGHHFVLTTWHAEEAQGKRCAVRIRSTDMNDTLIPGVFCFKDVAYLNKSTMSRDASGLGVCIPSLSIIKVSGWPDAAGAECSCGFNGILYAEGK